MVVCGGKLTGRAQSAISRTVLLAQWLAHDRDDERLGFHATGSGVGSQGKCLRFMLSKSTGSL